MASRLHFALGLVAFAAIQTGCATAPERPMYREKAGATQQDFLAARYACLQESSTTVQQAAVNAYGGASSTVTGCSYQMYDSCMGAKGFYVTYSGRFHAPVQCVRP